VSTTAIIADAVKDDAGPYESARTEMFALDFATAGPAESAHSHPEALP
jgi:hypothetical protein